MENEKRQYHSTAVLKFRERRLHNSSDSLVQQKADHVRCELEANGCENGVREAQLIDEEPSNPTASCLVSDSVRRRQVFRLKARLKGLIPRNPLDNLDTFFQSLLFSPAVRGEDDNTEEHPPPHAPVYDKEDDGASDLSDSDEESPQDAHGPGDIVWAKYGRMWYPAKVLSTNEIPIHLQKNLARSAQKDSVVVKWYGEDKYSRVKTGNVDMLAENKLDASRAAKNATIHLLYQLALSDLRQE